jgi:hypothetical protein
MGRPRPRLRVLEGLAADEEKACAALFQAFCARIGLDKPSGGFEKGVIDEEMESYFGSLEKDGAAGERFYGLSLSKFNGDDKEAVIFSLYLARKCWVPQGYKKLASAIESFYGRVLHDVPMKSEKERALKAFDCLVQAVLYKTDPSYYNGSEPNAGSACLENPRLKDGKRGILYGYATPLDPKVLYGPLVTAKPVAVPTGGKIRVITLDSAYNGQYGWINNWVGSAFRRFPFSIFGRSVGEWLKDCGESLSDSVWVCSGDLEAATDNIDSAFGDLAIDLICAAANLSDHADTIKGFTTRCVFPNELTQRRGQMMGSVISFPLLCMTSLLGCLYTRPGSIEFLMNNPPKSNFYFLKRFKECGINGDDTVTWGKERGVGERWSEGVEAFGGVVSRGKTLLNQKFFTVNSELWTKSGTKVPAVRPSFVGCLTDATKVVSHSELFEELSAVNWLGEEAKTYFGVTDRFPEDIPLAFGGRGTALSRDINLPRVRAWANRTSKEELEERGSDLGQAQAAEWKAIGKELVKCLTTSDDLKLIKDARAKCLNISERGEGATWQYKVPFTKPIRKKWTDYEVVEAVLSELVAGATGKKIELVPEELVRTCWMTPVSVFLKDMDDIVADCQMREELRAWNRKYPSTKSEEKCRIVGLQDSGGGDEEKSRGLPGPSEAGNNSSNIKIELPEYLTVVSPRYISRQRK